MIITQGRNGKRKDPIKHVILLMLENHSFDEMLGCFQEKYPHLEGVDPKEPSRSTFDSRGNRYDQRPKKSYSIRLDPKHDLEDVKEQLANGNGGFVKNFMTQYRCQNPTKEDGQNIMGYYPRGFLPALHALAEDFTICDHWFSSLPGPTWPNRLFALSGTSSGRVKMPEWGSCFPIDTIEDQIQPTIFDRLNEKGKTWKVFYYDFPNSLIFANQRKYENLAHYHPIDEFFTQDTRQDESHFPDFVFIEPKYFGIDQNDDHPSHNIMKAEKLVGDVYNAVRSNPSLWESTLLVVVFDEHGGFYDHVIPPSAVPPDDQQTEYDFNQLGLRVPAILVSPWVKRGVDQTVYDHTSLLKYLINKWNLGPLGKRTAQANSIEGAIFPEERRLAADMIASIRVPYSELVKGDENNDSLEATSHQEAIHVLADFIEKEAIPEESPLLFETVTHLSDLSRYFLNFRIKLGKKLQEMGQKLASSETQFQDQRIHKTTAVAAHLIGRAKGKQG